MIIYIQEGQRRIPIQYASRVRGRRMYQGGQTFLPLRVNQAGVIPIIFAVSILLFPQQLASYFTSSEIDIVKNIATGIVTLLPSRDGADLHRAVLPADDGLHVLLHGLHVQTGRDRRAAPQERRLHPGHPARAADPGLPARVVSRITFAGALFLAIVAVSPSVVALAFPDLASLGLGGTSLLIVVSVVVETMKQIEAQLMMSNYEGFIR